MKPIAIHPLESQSIELTLECGASKYDVPFVDKTETHIPAGAVAYLANELALNSVVQIEAISLAIQDSKKDDTLHVRDADISDAVDLARVELNAFKDVYEGEDKSVAEIAQIFHERLELLGGQWIKVLEDEQGIKGMLICCPTSMSVEEFSSMNMTENDSLKKAFDPSGDKIYIVNVASVGSGLRNTRYKLFAAALAEATKEGIQEAYFESRLPGFSKWLDSNCKDSDNDIDELADVYWQLKKNDKPLDPLLRMYTSTGSIPIKLVKNAWDIDKKSNGYGVLCKIENPLPDSVINSETAREIASVALNDPVYAESIARALIRD